MAKVHAPAGSSASRRHPHLTPGPPAPHTWATSHLTPGPPTPHTWATHTSHLGHPHLTPGPPHTSHLGHPHLTPGPPAPHTWATSHLTPGPPAPHAHLTLKSCSTHAEIAGLLPASPQHWMPSVLAAYEEVQPGLRYKGVDVTCSLIDEVKLLSNTHPNWCAAWAVKQTMSVAAGHALLWMCRACCLQCAPCCSTSCQATPAG